VMMHTIEPAPKRVRAQDPSAPGMPSGQDLTAVIAAVNSDSFQQAHEERLRVCAAGLSSLDERGREVSHRMFCHATRHDLNYRAGEQAVARVLGALTQISVSDTAWTNIWDEGCASLSSTEQVRLWHCAACMHDIGAWADTVDAAGEDATTSTSLLADTFSSLGITDAAMAAEPQLEEVWRDSLKQTVALLQRRDSLLDASDWHGCGCDDTAGVVTCKFCVWDCITSSLKVALTLMNLEMPLPETACVVPSPAGGWSAEAREMTRWILRVEGMVHVETLSAKEEMWRYSPPEQASFSEKAFHILFCPNMHYRVVEEEIEDGCRVVLFEWDYDGGVPSREHDCGLLPLCVISIAYDRPTRTWRAFASDVLPLPSSLKLVSPILTNAFIQAFVPLFRAQCRATVTRVLKNLCKVVDERAAAHWRGSFDGSSNGS
jgi:hypothetical protein